MGAHTDADVQAVAATIRASHLTDLSVAVSGLLARRILDALTPTIDRAKAEAWDAGYAVASDDFTHSDYCGFKCVCDGIHGQTNPHRADEIERTP